MTDSHCHIHEPDYPLDAEAVLATARARGVKQFVCVGTSAAYSRDAVAFAAKHDDCVASVAVHPHDAEGFGEEDQLVLEELLDGGQPVAIGECGLDYYYEHSPRQAQQQLLHWHLRQAVERDLPLLFHVRDAFDDFWSIIDQYQLPRGGVIHSFSSTPQDLEQALQRKLLVAYNGIMTFTKDQQQLAALDATPLEAMILETDAPFLTPVPNRGKINEPQYVCEVAAFIAQRRGIDVSELERVTDANVARLLAR